jgi:hypothetical protein
MVYFQIKNTNLGKFWKVLQRKMLVFLWSFRLFYSQMVYFMAIWYIWWPLGMFGGLLVYFSRFGMLYREKSGNPVHCIGRFGCDSDSHVPNGFL